MIIDKGVSPGEVVTIKLTSGEELIAKLVEENSTSFTLSRPLVVAMGAQGPGLIPYLFTVSPEKNVKLNRQTITVVEVSDPDFAKQYLQSTTGLVL